MRKSAGLANMLALVTVGNQNGHWVEVPGNEFTFEWEIIVNKSFYKHCIENLIDS